VQHAANRRNNNRLSMRNLQSCAKPCNALLSLVMNLGQRFEFARHLIRKC
jgi:hypothetical protein